MRNDYLTIKFINIFTALIPILLTKNSTVEKDNLVAGDRHVMLIVMNGGSIKGASSSNNLPSTKVTIPRQVDDRCT
jgi:hypothetical protein